MIRIFRTPLIILTFAILTVTSLQARFTEATPATYEDPFTFQRHASGALFNFTSPELSWEEDEESGDWLPVMSGLGELG